MFFKNSFISFHCDTKFVGTQIRAGFPKNYGSHTPLLWATLLSNKTRPDTRLPQSRAGGQGPYLRSLDHLGRSREAKDRKK